MIAVFPLIVAIGAGTGQMDGVSTRIARFVGDLSYPLYITHYPLIYIYTEWIAIHDPSPAARAGWGAALVAGSLLLALACLKLYDEPVRRWLGRRLLPRTAG